jgi:Cu/Ag efflux protein CusF
MSRATLLAAATVICTLGVTHIAAAQKTVSTPGVMETTTATIQKVDVHDRFVVLRGDDGSDVGVFAPPEFTRFGELRVGDRITITYYESTVFQVKRRHSPMPAVSEEVSAAENHSSLPSATVSHQTTARVTVTKVDREASLITVVGRDGRAVSRRVQDPSHLDGVKQGDDIDITYTEALLASVARVK